ATSTGERAGASASLRSLALRRTEASSGSNKVGRAYLLPASVMVDRVCDRCCCRCGRGASGGRPHEDGRDWTVARPTTAWVRQKVSGEVALSKRGDLPGHARHLNGEAQATSAGERARARSSPNPSSRVVERWSAAGASMPAARVVNNRARPMIGVAVVVRSGGLGVDGCWWREGGLAARKHCRHGNASQALIMSDTQAPPMPQVLRPPSPQHTGRETTAAADDTARRFQR
ncbi:hypothetical protein FRC08_011260, partial [Ceratobasidium sp. 394]